jgi:hypothetical protein
VLTLNHGLPPCFEQMQRVCAQIEIDVHLSLGEPSLRHLSNALSSMAAFLSSAITDVSNVVARSRDVSGLLTAARPRRGGLGR